MRLNSEGKLRINLSSNDDAAQLQQQFLSGLKKDYVSVNEMLPDFTYANPPFTYYSLEITYLDWPSLNIWR